MKGLIVILVSVGVVGVGAIAAVSIINSNKSMVQETNLQDIVTDSSAEIAEGGNAKETVTQIQTEGETATVAEETTSQEEALLSGEDALPVMKLEPVDESTSAPEQTETTAVAETEATTAAGETTAGTVWKESGQTVTGTEAADEIPGETDTVTAIKQDKFETVILK